MPRQHDQEDTSVLVERALADHESSLIAYTAGILAGDLERAREVVQDAFLKLCRADPGRVRDNVKAWLYTVCRNRALDVLRKEQRLDLGNEEFIDSTPSQEPDPAKAADTRELSAHAWNLLERLTENQREVIRLKFLHDCSYQQIADITGLTTGNVGFIMHTGIKKLRQMMERTLAENPRLRS
jgi:RNA polymerase sigma-70 factor (ECF subfamily)